MAESNLNQLNPARFSELLVNRERAITEADTVLKEAEPAVNRLAKALHPSVQHLVVSRIIEEAVDTKSYICTPDRESGTNELAYFSAGQYLSVSVTIDGKRRSRPYSLSSSPKESLRGEYRITVKRVPGGQVSNYILDHFEVGTKFDVSDPCGCFTYEPLRDEKHVIGIAGGSGITPFISMARAIIDGDEDFTLTVLYGCRTEADILFRDELEALRQRTDKLRVVYVLSDEAAAPYEQGYITHALVEKYKSADTYSVLICGPQAMTDYLSKELRELHLRRKYIRYELRGEKPVSGVADESVTLTVRAQNGVARIVGNKAESILRILENAGIAPPSRCRSGECGFCRSRLISGEVFLSDATDMRRMADKKFGYIHPCCTYALGDIEIEVSALLPTNKA